MTTYTPLPRAGRARAGEIDHRTTRPPTYTPRLERRADRPGVRLALVVGACLAGAAAAVEIGHAIIRAVL